MTRSTARFGRYLLPGIAAALLLAGCGDDSGTTISDPAPSSTAVTAPTTTAAPPSPAAPGTTTAAPTKAPTVPESTPVSTRCHTSELTATLGGEDAAAGNRYATLTLKNKGSRTCTVYGYGGLQPTTASGKQLALTLTRDASAGGPKLVRLAPGASVGRTIHWSAVPNGEASCPKGSGATVIPPDETDPLKVTFSFGEICGSTIEGTPFGVTR